MYFTYFWSHFWWGVSLTFPSTEGSQGYDTFLSKPQGYDIQIDEQTERGLREMDVGDLLLK